MPTVTLATFDTTVDVGMGQTLLDAALAAGVDYPHSCKAGNCSACKSKLLSGEVDLMPYSEFALSDEDRDAGYILACRCMVWEDSTVVTVGVDDVGDEAQNTEARIRSVESVTHDIKRITLEAADGALPRFKPGQFANLGFTDLPGRDYSMAGSADDPVWEFHIRRMAGGWASHYVADRLTVGERVLVKGPMGDAFLRTDHDGPILAVAGGSGMAPIKSIVEAALSTDANRHVHMYFGVRDERDLYLTDHFLKLVDRYPNLRFTPVLSEVSEPSERRTGFVHHAVEHDIDDLDGFKAYMAGPPVMVEATHAMLVGRGVRAADIHADAFYSTADNPAGTSDVEAMEAANV